MKILGIDTTRRIFVKSREMVRSGRSGMRRAEGE
jgi:hypothetical protein